MMRRLPPGGPIAAAVGAAGQRERQGWQTSGTARVITGWVQLGVMAVLEATAGGMGGGDAGAERAARP